MSSKYYSCLILSTFVLSGCGNPPGIKEVEATFREENKYCFDLMEASQFEKINGTASGEQGYMVEYKYQAKVLDTGHAIEELKKEGMRESDAKYLANTSRYNCLLFTAIDFQAQLSNKNYVLNAGDHFEIRGKMMFVKSEKGWVLKP